MGRHKHGSHGGAGKAVSHLSKEIIRLKSRLKAKAAKHRDSTEGKPKDANAPGTANETDPSWPGGS